MRGPSSPLDPLRAQIADADRAIAEAVRRRVQLSEAVARAKAVANEPTRDFAVEARVLGRWRELLAPAGVAPGRAEALARWLIEESVRTQEAVPRLERVAAEDPREVAIVGGAGAMGGWLARYFEDGGHRVRVVDPRACGDRATYPRVAEAAARSDVLVFATPIRSTEPVLREALEGEANPLVFDVLSVKAPIAPVLRAAARAGRRVTSVHPMFGPSARTLSGRNLLLVGCGNPAADREARALFAGSALSIAELPLEDHDRLIAESLGLAHAVNLLFLAALGNDPATPHELARAASTTFHRQSSLARSVADEGPELYLDIQSLNPNSAGMYEELRRALDRLERIVQRRDLQRFSELLRSGAVKLDPGASPMRA